MKNVIACRPYCYGKFLGPNAYKHLAGLGITDLEWHFTPGKERAELDDLKSNGMKVVNACISMKLNNEQDVAAVVAELDTVASLGVRRCFASASASAETPKKDAYARLRKIGEEAAKRKIVIVIETHEPLGHNSKVIRETMTAVNLPSIRSNFDTANIYYYNHDVDGVKELAAIAEFVEGVHLKDTDGGYHSFNFPALGRGIVNFKRTFEILNGRGFHGPFTLEIEGTAGENISESETFERVGESILYLKKIGVMD
ncbi:MAG TPA: sugar phosphate isomerase/epimerase family protein [Candidatus Brocadiia bacterium]|nr:sugar phosphate isomerase/epimerase family protein [Candidatus Brocadiia bacterium]